MKVNGIAIRSDYVCDFIEVNQKTLLLISVHLCPMWTMMR